MEIGFYHNASDNNVINKNITLVKTENIFLKEKNISLVTPSLYLDNINIETNMNYCFITDFNRYYFIKSKNILCNGVIELFLEIDVLMSYKNIILESYGVVTQSINNAKTYASDHKVLDTIQTKIIDFENTNLFSNENKLYLTGVN